MSKRKFSALALAVIGVIVAVALLAPKPTGRDAGTADGVLLPALAERVNEIDRIEVTGAGNETLATLERGAERWTVAELGNYPADWSKVRELLAGLAQVQVVEVKTANPEYHDRLGVGDVSAASAEGHLVELSAGDQRFAVIVGRNAAGRSGRYLRVADSDQSYLTDFDARLPLKAVDWAEREVTDIASDEVAEVEITHPDGEVVRVHKASADDTDFTLQGLPEGRELQSAWAVNSLGGALTALQMDDARPASEMDWTGATRVRVLTFDGLQIDVDARLEGEEHWIRLQASAPYAEAEVAEAARTVTDAEADTDVAADTDSAKDAAAGFNARVDGWAYRIPAYKFESMTKRMNSMLKPLDEET